MRVETSASGERESREGVRVEKESREGLRVEKERVDRERKR